MTKPKFTGVYPILPTPFRDDETIDLDSYARIVRFMVDIGVDGVTILGVLGEANRLIDQERQAVIQTAVEAAERSAKSAMVAALWAMWATIIAMLAIAWTVWGR